MTITDEDREQFRVTTADFHAQPEPDNCLPTAVKNVLGDLADRKDEPELEYSVSDIANQLDYQRGAAATSSRVASRIDPLIEDAGYEVKTMVGVDIDQLQTVIESEDRSLPICELHSEYFDDVDQGYSPEPGRDEYGRFNHVVIPMATNDESILFYDPFVHFFAAIDDSTGVAMERSMTEFYEWWSRPEKRWTLWVEPMSQQTLSAST